MDSVTHMGPQTHNSRKEAMFSQPTSDPREPLLLSIHPKKFALLEKREKKDFPGQQERNIEDSWVAKKTQRGDVWF